MRILIAPLMLISTLASAGTIKIVDIKLNPFRTYSISSEFAVNRDLGRVWVKTSITSTQDGPIYDDVQSHVEGLSYRASTGEIILVAEGAEIICGTLKGGFLGRRVKETGKCRLSNQTIYENDDDSFEVKTVEKTRVLLKY